VGGGKRGAKSGIRMCPPIGGVAERKIMDTQVKVVLRPNPTLATVFHCRRQATIQQIQKHFKAQGIGAEVTPEWVPGPYSGTECCIGMELTIPERLLGNGYETAPFWAVVYELGKPG